MDFFNDLGQGKLFNTFRTELGKVGDAAGYFSIVISSLLQLIVYLIIPIYLNHELTLTLIFSSFFYYFFLTRLLIGMQKNLVINLLLPLIIFQLLFKK